MQTRPSPSGTDPRHDNRTGIFAMLGAMAAFAANDTCIKLMGENLPLGEVVTLRSAAATVTLLIAALIAGDIKPVPKVYRGQVGWRVALDLFATFCIVAAVLNLPLAEATAINQFTPLAMTAAAALFLGERVPLSLWGAAAVGLFGVALIVRPGTEAFTLAAIFPLAGVAFVAARDIITRQLGDSVPMLLLAGLCTLASTLAGLSLWTFETWIMPGPRDLVLIVASGLTIVAAYLLIIVAMRFGDVATVSPFRYAVIVFSLIPSWLIWNKIPDIVQLLGIAILTAAGIYTFQSQRSAKPAAAAQN